LNQLGTATISVTVSDGVAAASHSFVLTVTPLNRPPIARASASPVRVISSNNVNARVALDGSRSSDPDGDALTYLWFADGNLTNPIGTGFVGTVNLSIGLHKITLVVSDGLATASDVVMVTVVTASQAMDQLIDRVSDLNIHPALKRDIIPSLEQAKQDVERGDISSALSELRSLQHKIESQPPKKIDSATAQVLILEIQQIIDALQGQPDSPKKKPKNVPK
jgi:hypothetical protein